MSALKGRPRVLVIDDEPAVRALLRDLLDTHGIEPIVAASGGAALATFRRQQPQVVLLDLRMPGVGGMQVLADLKAIDARVSVIILTAHGDIPRAVEAMRLGAYDFLTKPSPNEVILSCVQRALERSRLFAEVRELRDRVGRGPSLEAQMGPGAAVQRIVEQVEQVAESDLTVLIYGETGTGKELVARAIHDRSSRRGRPFIALDCGAIPDTLVESELFGYERGAFTGAERRKEGYFQLAEGGAIFLDEVGNLPLAAQAKLLRALPEREIRPVGGRDAIPVDVRVIAATNAPLEGTARAGRFRQDLYYRLAEFTIALVPLRERAEDIPHLARRFADEAAMEFRRPVHEMSESAIALLAAYPWPGNARELRNVIRQAVLRSDGAILPEHLALETTNGPSAAAVSTEPLDSALTLHDLARLAARDAEQRAIRQAIRASGGNKTRAARALGIDYTTLHRRMRQYGISPRSSSD
jgi:DNA-binding NtrC family response regulator